MHGTLKTLLLLPSLSGLTCMRTSPAKKKQKQTKPSLTLTEHHRNLHVSAKVAFCQTDLPFQRRRLVPLWYLQNITDWLNLILLPAAPFGRQDITALKSSLVFHGPDYCKPSVLMPVKWFMQFCLQKTFA